MRMLVAWLLLAASLGAAEMRVVRDLPYVAPPQGETTNERQSLDVYAPAEGEKHPVAIWIHGGGWRRGDKRGVQLKPAAFVERGYLFVSITYRFFPEVTIKEMTGDIAKAIRWVHDHAKEYGGDPTRLCVLGHSAGAHLAALVCTDDRYLREVKVPLADIKGCVPVDVSVYDIPTRLKMTGSVDPKTYIALFGEDESMQRDYSPVAHVAAQKSIPSFLILHVASRPETKAQSELFAKTLQDAGIAAQVVSAEGKTHGTISSDLGKPDDAPTVALFQFLSERLK